MTNDAELPHRHADERSAAVFAELVWRHLGLMDHAVPRPAWRWRH